MAGHITALRYQKRSSERVNIFLDGRYALAVPATVAATLQRGQYLSDQDLVELQTLNDLQRAYERALRLLAHRPRSEAEIRQRLLKSNVTATLIDSVIDRLKTAGYLDDLAFAQFWVSDRERFRPRGTLALRQELRQKGIADSIINQVLQTVDPMSSAYQAGRPRAERLAQLDEHTFRQKVGSYLLRRGFRHEEVWPTVEQLWRDVSAETVTGET